MLSPRVIAVAFIASALAIGADAQVQSTVDLREPGAIERLGKSNPEHFEKIRQALIRLQETPRLAEGDWLELNIDARDVEFSDLLFKTSNPPKQLLQFSLDDVRYTMHLVRSDLTARAMPAQ